MTRHHRSWIRGLLLSSALIQVAAAQTTCIAFVANQPIMRQEGVAEPAGDIVINCQGTPQRQVNNITMFTSATITSRVLGTVGATAWTEAALFINDTGTPTQGQLQNGALVFANVVLPNLPSYSMRITNVRVNASSQSAGSFVTATVLGTFPLQNQSGLVLGAVQSTLFVHVSPTVSSNQQCNQQTVGTATVNVSETVQSAFKLASVPGNSTVGNWFQNGINTESQSVLTSPAGWVNQIGAVPGQADAGTRLRVNIANIPVGVTVTLPVSITDSTGGTLVINAGGDTGPFVAATGSNISLGSSGSVTYEVRAQNAGQIDSFTIPITINAAANTGAGTLRVSATYAPTSVETGSAIPRFADTSLLVPVFNLLSCLPATHLLFTTQPVNGVAGVALPSVAVQSLDMFGYVTATNAAVTLTSSPAAINATSNAVAGIATFSGLVVGTPGAYTLTANSPGLAAVTSRSFIIRGPTTVSLSSTTNSLRYGQKVTLTATVSPAAATGQVTFYDGTTILGIATLSGGQAQLITILPASGTRILQARYGGNPTYSGSLSGPLHQNTNAVAANAFQNSGSYLAGVGPSSVVVGDLNGDGFADLIVADNPGASVSVLLGSGDGTFRLQSPYAVGNEPVAVALGDFNLDGKPDIAVANSMDGTISLLLGNGDGTFQTGGNVGAGSKPMSLAAADFNGDGIPDLAVGNFLTSNLGSPANVRILIGIGDGTFQPANQYSVVDTPISLASGDFNGDGIPDLAVAGFYGGSVSLFLGNVDGTLQNPVVYSTGNGGGAGPVSVTVADLNADGIADLAVANLYENDVSIFLGNGNGTFKAPISYPAGTGPYSIATGDFDGNGTVDLVVADISTGTVSVLPGNGDGTFRTAISYAAGNNPQSVAVGDFNGDARTDIVAANFSDNSVSVLLGATIASLTTSGRVTLSNAGLAGVIVNLTGSQTSSIVTDPSGNYSFSGLPIGGNFTVTPALSGFTFTPPAQTFTNLASNQILNFTASPTITNVVVSGQVTTSNGGLSGASIFVNGTKVTLTVTDSSGNYAIALPTNGTYTISAALSGYSFSSAVTFPNLTANQTANFTGVAVTGLEFFAVTPCRVADTRSGAGFAGQFGPPSMTASSTRTFPIPAGHCGIPATAAAYSLNVTAVPKGYLGFLSIWPSGQPQPNASTLNSYNGSVVANAAIVPAGNNGAISVFVTDPSDVLFDINGYFAPPPLIGLEFFPVTPCRVADTRSGAGKSGAFGAPIMAAGSQRSFPIPASTCSIPSSASAYSLNFTAVPQGYLGFLTTWPTGQPQPNASTLNSYNGAVIANAAIVPAGTNGAVSAFVTDLTDLLFDINGYFGPPATTGLKFYPVTPCRVADTRSGTGFSGSFGPPTMDAGGTRTFPIPASSCGIPSTAAAYSLNVTAIPNGYLGYLSIWPTGQARPGVSTFNSYSGTVVANAAIVPAGSNGFISIYVTDPTDVLFDINGYFAP